MLICKTPTSATDSHRAQVPLEVERVGEIRRPIVFKQARRDVRITIVIARQACSRASRARRRINAVSGYFFPGTFDRSPDPGTGRKAGGRATMPGDKP